MEQNKTSYPQVKRSSSEALPERSTPCLNPCNLCKGDADIFPELLSQVLKDGHKVRFRAPGKSMQPAILDGDCLMVEPIESAAIMVGDIILYQADERIVAHRVMNIGKGKITKIQPAAPITHYSFILRGDASYSYDEPVYPDQILGKIVSVERNGRIINPYSSLYKISCIARVWVSRLKTLLL